MADIAVELELAAARFADRLVAVPDPTAKAGTLDWSVHDLGAHVAAGSEAYASMAAGERTPLDRMERMPEIGPELIAREASTSIEELADRVRAGSARLAKAVEAAGGDAVPFYEHTFPGPVVGGLFLAELLVHGFDLGVPTLSEDGAALAALAVPNILPLVLKPGTPARTSIAFKVRRHGEVVVDVEPDRAVVGRAGGPVDARLSGRPVELLLTAYQRINPLGPMLKGRLSVTGRRPWRLRALQTRFDSA